MQPEVVVVKTIAEVGKANIGRIVAKVNELLALLRRPKSQVTQLQLADTLSQSHRLSDPPKIATNETSAHKATTRAMPVSSIRID